jgi:hypothetical protein
MSAPVAGPPVEDRQGGAARAVAGALAPAFLTVVGLTVLLAALFTWRGAGTATRDATPPGAPAPVTSSAPSGPAPATGSSPAESPAPSGSAPAASPAPSGPASAASPAPSADRPEVVVLDQTGDPARAEAAAQRLRSAGWSVALVGRFRGTVRATTVYYPRGERAAAEQAADALAVPERVLPRFGNLSTSRLTVVVTDNLPAGGQGG